MSQTDRNGVTNDPTSPPAFLNWRGQWLTATEYRVYDAFYNTGSSYIVTSLHISGNFLTDLASGFFELMAAQGTPGAGTGDMLAANNLSEVNAAAAASNLGVARLAGATFTGDIIVPDETYGAGWATNLEVPTKKAVYGKIETINPSSFASGTRMPFNQTAAPTGWTKDTTFNDSVMRVVSGAVSNGGSVAFSTFNGQTATGAYTLQIADIPSHSHSMSIGGTITGNAGTSPTNVPFGTTSTGAQGGGGAHSHTLTHNIKYNDFIIAQKD